MSGDKENVHQETPEESPQPGQPGQSRQSDEKQDYDREAKLKELLEQDEKTSPWVDPFMGF
jgi:hypothetical protein